MLTVIGSSRTGNRQAEEQYERLPGLAAELVGLKPDVIVVASPPAIRAAQKATAAIPIIMCASGDPIGSGFIKSLSRPGGNITGLSNLVVDLTGKYLELLRVAVPKLSRVAVLVNPGHPNHPEMLKNGVDLEIALSLAFFAAAVAYARLTRPTPVRPGS